MRKGIITKQLNLNFSFPWCSEALAKDTALFILLSETEGFVLSLAEGLVLS